MQELRFFVVGILRVLSLIFRGGASRRPDVENLRGIYGWYGTETLGDKLILMGLLRGCYQACSSTPVVIYTTDLPYSESTLNEILRLSRMDAEYSKFLSSKVSVSTQKGLLSLRKGDQIVLGGGPIMDDPELMKWAFLHLYLGFKGVTRSIVGCGLGPLRMKSSFFWVKCLMATADRILLRPSQKAYHSLAKNAYFALCPSFASFRELSSVSSALSEKGSLAFNIRELPSNYLKRDDGDVATFNSRFQASYMTLLVRLIAEKKISKLMGFSTHERDLTGDSILCDAITDDLCNKHGLTGKMCTIEIEEVINCILKSECVISTRYHGVILSFILNREVLGVDYTSGGGKLGALYESIFGDCFPVNLQQLINMDEKDVISVKPLKLEGVEQLAEDTMQAVARVLV